MTTRFNHTGDFLPKGWGGIDEAFIRPPEDPVVLREGLYYRSRIFPALAQEVEACLDGTLPVDEVSLNAYQSWNEAGWKAPHGSYDAVHRFGDKLAEELIETDDALEEFWDGKGNGHLVEELGDVLWVTTALVNNGGAVMADGLKQRLYDYVAGTLVHSGHALTYPDWYDAAAQTSIKKGQVTTGDIDRLLDVGFVPTFTPIMNQYEPEEISPHGLLFQMRAIGMAVTQINERQYAYGEEKYVSPTFHQEMAQHLGIAAAEMILGMAAIVKYTGGTFSQLAHQNIVKIASRIATNTVDKTDGERPQPEQDV